jgi:hypothetical protein
MKRILLLFASATCICTLYAQDSKKVTAYAITGVQKGSSAWTEVRLVDVNTGDEVQSIYKSANQVEALNARTGKAIKKDVNTATTTLQEQRATPQIIQVTNKDDKGKTITIEKRILVVSSFGNVDMSKPFSTNSAALAYDKKHERLYYTPMGINQLRYIDLKSGNIYYFEDEPFGVLKGRHDIQNQITRMVIASDGNGYALTNNSNHLIQFTTGKKPTITDLGPVTDDAANGAFSVHNSGGYGGDIVADAQKNIYLITANRNVFKISLETKVGTFMGAIQGLPKGFSTNGAVVDGGSKIIVTSSTSTAGYFSVDLNSLQATKVSSSSSVFNASDLANANLLFDKKKKDKKEKEIKQPIQDLVQQEPTVKTEEVVAERPMPNTVIDEAVNPTRGSIVAYPNPVVNGGTVKLAFNNQPAGRYKIEFMDADGKIVSQQQTTINNKTQIVEVRIPTVIAAGNYMIRVLNEANELASVNKLVVQ